MKVLIVEDEIKTGDYLRQGLNEAGYNTDLARTGIDGLHLALTGGYELLILDVMLPGLDGWQLLETVRRGGSQMPVLFLTARDQVEDRVKGLELGADDYLVKPFSLDELLARLRALVRRPSQRETPVLRHGPLAIDPRIRAAHFDGRELSLTPKEYALLELLVRQRGHVLSRAQIFEHLYDAQSDASDKVVEVIVSTLRGKLNAAGATELIQTRRGFGYVVN